MQPSAYPAALLVAVAAACSPGISEPPPEVTLAALAPTPGPAAQVGTDLNEPLRVEVRVGGTPTAGIQVTWRGSRGEVTPPTSITDAQGIATARWRLGTLAGTQEAWATIREASRPAYFRVDAVPGPPETVAKVSGDGQVINVLTGRIPEELVVQVLDRFGNTIPDAPVVWSVLDGPAEIAEPSRTDGAYYRVRVAGTGQPGVARIQASVGGIATVMPFTVEFGAGPWIVAISNLRTYHLIGFLSMQNGTTPAVDTIPSGATVRFRNEDYWDVAPSHDVEPVGEPAMPTCQLSWVYDSTCEVTLALPGTYRYRLSGNPLATGTIVVRSP